MYKVRVKRPTLVGRLLVLSLDEINGSKEVKVANFIVVGVQLVFDLFKEFHDGIKMFCKIPISLTTQKEAIE
jgi:hypothetical protein